MRIFGIPLIDTSLIKVGQRDVIRDLFFREDADIFHVILMLSY